MTKMKQLVIGLVAFAAFYTAGAQTQKEKAATYIAAYSELAINEEIRTGVPASITLAQGLIETMNGQSPLCVQGNNHFGIKCKNDWTGETMSHDDDAKGECFRKYNSAEHSFRDHSDFLLSRPHYAFLFKLDPTDYEGWARGLKKAGYATSPTYAQKLIKTIVDNDLQQFTLVALERSKDPLPAQRDQPLFASASQPANGQPAEEHGGYEMPAETARTTAAGTAARSKEQPRAMLVAQTIVEAPSYPTEVFTINNLKVIYAGEGTSLFALASKYSISYDKLLGFNDLKDVDIIEKGQLVFLENKEKKGHAEVHIVQAGETLYDVAQREGMHIRELATLNHLKVSYRDVLTAGTRLNLREAKK
jgi:LysM repeat protein